ncbi:MAG: pyridoxal phosphate-dependent aminotransferase [SAR202 cluster bacterium]|nr:aspartate aminotransferase [Chloroflexota bacterium]MQG17577.1 pyridoxal phosphate-dependent aminotransferase [SAR202 cluster bacterium]MQG36538.1 pyridoxal phosphate-dependent aminotransferase [SAR202 cluster bacterium]MQG86943.1 pyridoxal phosphate-dependent aminotransferase [SAR202 cluster bacterium]|tara:strand:+ start:2234 stop:3400 length:1167 start_codon:yes stop_codon:yes gene_type:complete
MGIASRMNLLGTETAFEVLSRARNLEAQGKQIVHLEIGEPDFDTPSHIVDAGVQALKDGYTHYGPTPGLPQLREAISENSRKVRGLNTDPNSIVVTPGAKPIMFYVILALSEPGMEVIYPNPGFPIYESMIKFSGAKPVPMQLLEESGYHPDLNDLKNKVNDKTSLIILNSPENPCGSALSAEELNTIADIVKQHPNLYVMADEIYKDILYQGEHSSIAAIEGMQDRTIILDGFSKSYAMTGWRLGYGIMPLELVPHIVKLAVNSVSCAASFSQIAAIAALEGSQEEVLGMAQEFSERKTLIVEGLRSIKGIRCPEPEGAFYVFPNISETGLSSNDFEDRALNEAGVALLAGSAFGEFGEGYVRLSYANSKENIEIAINSLDKFVNSL